LRLGEGDEGFEVGGRGDGGDDDLVGGEVFHEGGLAGAVEFGEDVVEEDKWGEVFGVGEGGGFDEFLGDDDGAVFAAGGGAVGELAVEGVEEVVAVGAESGGADGDIAGEIGFEGLEIGLFVDDAAGIFELDLGWRVGDLVVDVGETLVDLAGAVGTADEDFAAVLGEDDVPSVEVFAGGVAGFEEFVALGEGFFVAAAGALEAGV